MNYSLSVRLACSVFLLVANTACANTESANAEVNEVGEHLRYAGDSVQLGTHTNGRHTFVTGHFGEKGPFNIIVDTGAGVNVIDTKLAEEMGLQKVGEREVLSGGVEPVRTDVVIVPHMVVDGLSIEGAEFITTELGEMSLGEFHGVLGMGLFQDALITFDLQNEKIVVSETELSAGEPGVMPYDADMSGFKIEMEAAGQKVKMNLDTGAPTGFTFPYALHESLPLKGELVEGPPARLVGGERSTWSGTLDGDIKLGDRVYKNPDIMFLDPSAPHGNIGTAVLGELVMSFDQKNTLLALRPSKSNNTKKAAANEKAGEPRRLGVQLRGMGGGALAVAMVVPGSLGEQAGFKAGDVLVTINGRPATEFDMSALGALFGGNEPLRFEVDRDGERRIIEIK